MRGDEIIDIAVDVGKQLAYEIHYKDVLEPTDIKYLSLSPEIIQEIVRAIHDSGILQELIEEGVDITKDVIKTLIAGAIFDYIRQKRGQKKILDISHFGKIAIKGTEKSGKLAIYNISKPIKIHPYQNIALFGIEGTPVLDFRDMDPNEACFKLSKNSTLFLKNLKIKKYRTQKLSEGDGRVIYDERDVIIEDIAPPENETEEEYEREGYFEIEFR